MVPGCRVFSEGKVLYSGCDGRHFEVMRGMVPPDIYHRPLPTTLIDVSNLPLAGLSEPVLTSVGRIVDNTIVLLPFIRDRSIALMLASAAGELCPAHFLPNPFAPNHSQTSMDWSPHAVGSPGRTHIAMAFRTDTPRDSA